MAVKHIVRVNDEGNESSYQEKTLTRKKAIRLRCLDCCSFIAAEVRECTDSHCALFPFRLGKDPSVISKNTGNAEFLNKYRKEKAIRNG